MISQSQLLLFEALKASLFDVKPHFSIETDWDWNEVIVEAKVQTVLSLISHVLPDQYEISAQGKAMYMRIMYEQDRLIKCFDAENIPCVILKGSAAALYYPQPYLRTMGDIDVLVPKNRFLESLKVLESNGYLYNHGKDLNDLISDDTRELAYTKNGILVEIHQRFSSPGFDVDDILEKAIVRREYKVLNGYRFPMLPGVENGIVLLGHINQHLVTNVLGLRQIIDWAMYLHSITDKASWSKQFLPIAEKTGLLTLCAYVTRICNKYIGLPDVVNFGIDVDDVLVDELIDVVMTNGNFGRRIFVDKTAEEKSMLSASYNIKSEGFFRYFTRVGLGTSSFCRKHHSFWILAFFYGVFRQICKGIRAIFNDKDAGKKMVEGKELYEEHLKRYELYKKLGIKTGDK